MISIIIPYLSNSVCIKLCKEKIKENTINTYEIVEVVDSTDVYDAYNKGASKAKYDILIFLNDDMVVAPNWDKEIVNNIKEKTVVTNYLVECGFVDVSSNNIWKNFGDSPDSFKYEEFKEYAKDNKKEDVKDGFGWYMPFAIKKKSFIEYPNTRKHPHPNDVTLFNVFQALEYRFLKVNSFTYHFQRMATRDMA